MNRFILLLLVMVLLMSGCGTEQPDAIISNESVEDNQIVRLADVDFVTVPKLTFYVLLEEELGTDNIFVRRYAKYDGPTDTVSEEVQEAVLPREFKNSADAKAWLQEFDPQKLMLPQHTYVSDSVLAVWEEEKYEAVVEETEIISLEILKRRGAISRLNETFSVDKNPEALIALIESMETKYLKQASGIVIERKLDPLPLSFSYQTILTLNEAPNDKSSRELAKVTVILNYRIDELGNPLALELSFDAYYENILAQTDPALLNDMGAFTRQMFHTLTNQLNLHGVNADNPSLAYANATLYYESLHENNRILDKIVVR